MDQRAAAGAVLIGRREAIGTKYGVLAARQASRVFSRESEDDDRDVNCFRSRRPHPPQFSSVSQRGMGWRRRAPMTMFVFAALTVTAFIWAITEPQSPHDLTMDEISQLVVLGFVP